MTATKKENRRKKIAHRIKVSEKWKVKLVVNAKRLSGESEENI